MPYPSQMTQDSLLEYALAVLQEINTTDGVDFHFIKNLLLNSFPLDERRPCTDLAKIISSKENFHCCLIMVGAKAVGVLNWWQFEDFNFLEHFAILPSVRKHGLGTAVLKILLTYGPLMLEVELPDTELKRSRIAFYERNKLRLWENVAYVQPAYSPGREPVTMLLMASPELQELQAKQYISTLYKNVYGKTD